MKVSTKAFPKFSRKRILRRKSVQRPRRSRVDEYRRECRRVVYIDRKTDALGIIDAVEAFFSKGGLAVMNAEMIIWVIFHSLEFFSLVFSAKDKHPYGHISFSSSYIGLAPFSELHYEMVKHWTRQSNKIAPHAKFTLVQLKKYLLTQPLHSQTLWPDHAIDGTPDAEYHPIIAGLDIKFFCEQIKGMDPACDSYSAWFDNLERPTGLDLEIRKRGIKRIFLVGLALDYCVGWSALAAAKLGYEVYVVIDGTKPVGMPKDSVQKIRRQFREAGVRVIRSRQLRHAPIAHAAAMRKAA